MKPNYTAQEVVEQVNEVREDEGLDKLTVSAGLTKSAQYRADYLCSTGKWSHGGEYDAIKKEYPYSLAGENLAQNFTQVDEMVSAWKESEVHYKNIVSDFKDIGVGIATCKERIVVVNHFGRPPVEQQPASSPPFTGIGLGLLILTAAVIAVSIWKKTHKEN